MTETSSTDQQLYRREPVSFVRRGERLNPGRQAAWDRLAGTHVLDVPRGQADTSVAPGSQQDLAETFGRTAPLIVDIGVGQGESTLAGAIEQPDTDFLALEVYTPGLAALLMGMERHGLTNVRGVRANAPEVLEHLLPENSVTELWIFFPDPWHKTRHHKRRLIHPGFVAKMARVLVPGGVVRLATDWADYADQMQTVMNTSEEFTHLHADSPGGWAPRFATRPVTSFENKAHRVGRDVYDLTFTLRHKG